MLIKYKIFTEFLKEHYLDTYVELCKTYAENLSKIYLNQFKTLLKETEKYFVEIYV